MTDVLRRLLETHEFCRQALNRYRHALDRAAIVKLEHDRDQAFVKLVTHVSANPNVTVAQINLLLSGLAQLAEEKAKAEHLRALCADAVARLAPGSRDLTLPDAAPAAAVPTPQLRQVLDTLPERAAILDSRYRYLYVNPANAHFHGLSVAEMENKPSWRVIGQRAFEGVMRPHYDRCIGGQTFNIYTRRSGTRLYRTQFSPLCVDGDSVASAVITVREVAHPETPDVPVWDVPEPDS